jgi:hypothetical protein
MRLRWLQQLAVIAPLSVLATGALISSEPSAGAGFKWKRVAVSEWDAAETGPDGRSIEVAYRTDTCGERHARASAVETSSSVTISVQREVAAYEGPGVMSCPAPRELVLSVPLRHPLAGRVIYGRSPAVLKDPREVFGESGRPIEMPRLIGFSPRDARQALVYGYLEGKMKRRHRGAGLPRVIAQSPPAGRSVRRGAAVQFVVAGS